MLLVDYRETELIECLQRRNVPHEVKPLPVGDLWLGVPFDIAAIPMPDGGVLGLPQQQQQDEKEQRQATPAIGLLIERKRIPDFEASFLDGRYREQRTRLLSFAQTIHAQPLYLLEGPWSTLTGRLTKKAAMKLLNRLQLRYQIPIQRTATVDETAEWVEALVEQWRDTPDHVQRTQELVKASDGIHVQKKANTAQTFVISCLAQCSGVSVKMAESLATAYPTLPALLALTPKEIEDHRVGTRRIGPAVSKRLWELLH